MMVCCSTSRPARQCWSTSRRSGTTASRSRRPTPPATRSSRPTKSPPAPTEAPTLSAPQIDHRAAAPAAAGAQAVLLLVEIVKLEQQLAQHDRGEDRDDDEEIARHHGPAR